MSEDGKKIPEIIPEILLEPLDKGEEDRTTAAGDTVPEIKPEIVPEIKPEMGPVAEPVDVPTIEPEIEPLAEPEPEPQAFPATSEIRPEFETEPEPEPEIEEHVLNSDLDVPLGDALEFEDPFADDSRPVEEIVPDAPPQAPAVEFEEETPGMAEPEPEMVEPELKPEPEPMAAEPELAEPEPETPGPGFSPSLPDDDQGFGPAEIPLEELMSEQAPDEEPQILDETPPSMDYASIIDDAPKSPAQPPDMFEDDDEPAVVWKTPVSEPEVPGGTSPESALETENRAEEAHEEDLPPELSPEPLPEPVPEQTPEPAPEPASPLFQPSVSTPDTRAEAAPVATPPQDEAEDGGEAFTFDTSETREPEAEVLLPEDAGDDSSDILPPVVPDQEILERGWIPAEPVPSTIFALSLGPDLYLADRGRLDRVENLGNVDRHITYIADYSTAPGPNVQFIDGPAKFAPVLLRKKLQEEGELTDEFTLITFQQTKISAQRTRICYELVPNAVYTGQMNNATRTRHGYLLHNTSSFLFGMLKELNSKKGVGLALHLPGHIVALAGKGSAIHFARRYPLAGEDEFSLRSGMAQMHQDMVALNTRGELEIPRIEWIEALSDELIWPDIKLDLPINRHPVTPLRGEEDNIRWTAIPDVLDHVSASTCLGPKGDVRMMPFVGAEKWLWIVLGGLGAVLLALATYLGTSTSGLERRADDQALENRYLNAEYKAEVQEINTLAANKEEFEDIKKLAGKIRFAGSVPPVARIWRELADTKPSQVHLTTIRGDYAEDGIHLFLNGSLGTGIIRPQEIFTDFMSSLEGAGYVVDSKSVVLDVDDNTFSMALSKKYKGS